MDPQQARREPEDEPRGGFVGFVRWYSRNRFHHMAKYLEELEQDPATIDAARVRERFQRATRHAQRVLAGRLLVTVLLAFGLVATIVASLMNAVNVPSALQGDVDLLRVALARVTAFAGSASVLLLVVRFAFDRYLRLLETSALLLAMQISAARGARPTGA